MILPILMVFSTLFSLVVVSMTQLTSISQSTLVKVETKAEELGAIPNIAQLLRAEIKRTLKTQKISSVEFLEGINCALDPNLCPVPLPAYFGGASPPGWATHFVGGHSLPESGPLVQVQLTEASAQNAAVRYVEFRAQIGHPLRPTVKDFRLNLGAGSVFSNALTGDTFRCLMCHGRVYGSIAEYDNHRGQGEGSQVHGTWYSAGTTLTSDLFVKPSTAKKDLSDYPHDDDDKHGDIRDYLSFKDKTLQQTWVKKLSFNHDGPELPWNLERQERMLPKFDPDVAAPLARGSIAGGKIEGVGFGANYPGTPMQAVNNLYEGNLILNGRDNGPLTIDGSVFVRGDVIIFGRVKGKGRIYSGRNIYIADDLEYVNSPPIFNGLKSQNTLMYNVDNNAESIAKSIQGYDRLALFATNNIIIGDPYPETANWELGSDIGYIIAGGLGYHDREVALDRTTGFLLDSIPLGPTSRCFLEPWSDPTTCLPESDPSFGSKVQTTYAYKYDYNDPALTTRFWADMAAGTTKYPMYEDLLFPKNMVNGNQQDWLSKEDYVNVTKNKAEFARSLQGIGSGAKRRIKTLNLRMPGSNPMDINSFSPTALINEIEKQTGAITLAGGLSATNKEPGSTRTMKDQLENFLSRCKQRVLGTAPGYNSPKTNLGGRDHITYFDTKDRVPLKYNGNNITVNGNTMFIYMADCQFYFVPSEEAVYTMVSHYGAKLGYSLTSGGPTPFIWSCTGMLRPDHPQGTKMVGRDGPVEPCLKNNDGTPQYPPFANDHKSWYLHMQAPFALKILWAPYPLVRLDTGYWDSTKLRPKNRVKKVQAFLFANHFVTHNMDMVADRQLRINGGIVAKDFFGRFINRLGYFRKYSSRVPTMSGWLHNYPPTYPGLIVKLDPRFQFKVDLINAKFADLEYVD